jgi:hypothetical protein
MKFHPDPIECVYLLPPKWLNDKYVLNQVITLFTRYAADISALNKCKKIQMDEKWDAYHAQSHQSAQGKRMTLNEICNICSKRLVPSEEGKESTLKFNTFGSYFPYCTHIFHTKCLEKNKKFMSTNCCPVCNPR